MGRGNPQLARAEAHVAPVKLVAVGTDDTSSLRDVRQLFEEYQSLIDADICFAGFSAELEGLPGAYAAPSGSLLLAIHDEQAVGCVALRRFDDARGEMKRLFVRPTARGLGIGRALLERVIHDARILGYREIILDTLPTMTEAQQMYRATGFVEIAPYATHPMSGTICLGKQLD